MCTSEVKEYRARQRPKPRKDIQQYVVRINETLQGENNHVSMHFVLAGGSELAKGPINALPCGEAHHRTLCGGGEKDRRKIE